MDLRISITRPPQWTTLGLLSLLAVSTGAACGGRDAVVNACASTADCSLSHSCTDGVCVPSGSETDDPRGPGNPVTDGGLGGVFVLRDAALRVDAGTVDAGTVDASSSPADASEPQVGAGDSGIDEDAASPLDAGGGSDAGALATDAGSDAAKGNSGDPCVDNAQCADSLYCGGDTCTSAGTCRLSTTLCPAIYDPVCGCNGMTYSNSCAAAGAGVRVQASNACP